jgi:hypothetical protein
MLIEAAALAALGFAGLVRADVTVPGAVPTNPPAALSTNVVMLDDSMPATEPTTSPASPVTPANAALAHVVPGYAASGFSATGYVEGSWTYSSHPPAGNILTDRAFDTKTESVQFDTVDVILARSIDPTKAFDAGFTIEQNYGWDSAYIHSDGLTIYSPGKTASQVTGGGSTATIHPKAQYDLTQADFVVSFGTVGNGLSVVGGKFDKLMGYENIEAPSNLFFTHSYIFSEEPLTNTGLIATYNLLDPNGPTPLTVTGGISRGWNQSTEDDNGSLDYLGQLKYVVTGKYSVALNIITGDEFPSGTQDGWRTVIDANGGVNISDELTLGYDATFAWEAQAKQGGLPDGTAIWYGAAIYASYEFSDALTFNVRGEWFDDQNGAAPVQLSSGATGIANQFYEVTVGFTIHPLPTNQYLSGLAIRPEGRWDYSDHAAFNGGAQNDQWTAAIEAYLAF